MIASRPRRSLLVLACLSASLVAAPFAGAASGVEGGDPAVVGMMSGLFEEGGSAQPACELTEDGFVTCKPTAVSAAVLDDGRVLYWNGIENTEDNVRTAVYLEAGLVLRDSQARVIDLSGSEPAFTDAARGTSGDNPAGAYEQPILTNPEGFIGTGRPGDGFTGSLFGQFYETDPVAPSDDPLDNDADMFCSDLSHLVDGRILVAGGTDFYASPYVPYDVPGFGGMGQPEIEGLRTAQVFDPDTDTWSRVGEMKYGRWYPTLTTLANGDVHVASGVTRLIIDTQLSQVRRTETFDLDTEQWTENYVGMASENSLPLYSRMHLAPNGKVFYAAVGQFNGFGPTGYAIDEALWGLYQFFNPATDQWEVAGATQWAGLARNGAFSTPLMLEAPYDQMDLLIGGGTLGSTPSSMLAMNISEIVSVGADDSVTSRTTGNLNNARWFSSGVLLPDGQVLAANGGTLDHVNASGFESPVREMELFDPETETWTPVASTNRDRVYHNTAILLPDGRVLIGGHSPIPLGIGASHQDFGSPMANNRKDPSFEIWSPPYLFRGDRPSITTAPSGIAWDSDFQIVTPDAPDIESVTLIRMPDASHTVDADQRGVRLEFTAGRGTLTATVPNGNIVPAGQYYLFINRSTEDGPVPSTAAMVNVGPTTDHSPASVTGYDSAAVADQGSATTPTDENILTALATRSWPGPGFEELLVELFGGAVPEEYATMSPADAFNQILAAAGQDMTAEEFLDELWAQSQAIFGPGAEGLWEVQGAMSMVASLVAPGAFPNPLFDGAAGPAPPENDPTPPSAAPPPSGGVEGESSGPLPATGGGFALLGVAAAALGAARRRRR